MTSRLALFAALSIALAACGSEKTETTDVTGDASTSEAHPFGDETAAPEVGATPDAAASDAAMPDPTPSASASSAAATPTPAPTASKVAAAGPPDAFKQCSVCHSIEKGKNLIGPSLAGIYGTKAGEVPGFAFSQAMKDSGMVWNEANLDKYLADPKGTIPGNMMSFAGVKDAAKRQAIIDYLKTI